MTPDARPAEHDQLGSLHHVGYLAADLDAAVEECQARLGLRVLRRFEREQFALVGVYLGEEGGNLELFAFTDPALQRRRSDGRRLQLDHVAYRVRDIEATVARLAGNGVRFCGPDQREPLHAPVDLGGVLHIWTVPETSAGQSIQLLQD